jgi:tetratricopeptide (TPR) repeat protein
MIEQHYTDEALLSLLDARGTDTLLGDPHLAACATCADALESYKDLAGLMNEKEVWDEEDAVFESAPVPETLSRIRAFADATAREDADAVQLVNELLELPSEWWGEEVRNDDRYHTAGVVRRLIAMVGDVVVASPLRGLTLSSITVEVAAALDPARYSEDCRGLLLGNAHRERGWALMYTGRDIEALRETELAGEALSSCIGVEVDRARVEIVRSLAQRQLEKYDDALVSARSAASVFRTYGLDERRRAAEWAESMVLVTTGRYREAISRFRNMESEMSQSPAELAGVLMNTAYCYKELREFDNAMPLYQFAVGVYEDLGNRSEALRAKSMIASVFAGRGDLAEAEKRYRAVRPQLESAGMARDAALAGLSMAEIALAGGRFAEADELCRRVIAHFEEVQAPYTMKALEALTYLREAVAQRKASAAVAEAVRKYVSRLPQQPNLLFAPPPLP